ncbi:MAG: Ig-like domain-containing protein [Microcoleaceae cyanobacterium]
MSIPIQSINASYENLPENQEDQYTAASTFDPDDVINYDFQVGEENNLRISGFTDANGENYTLIETINQIDIQRIDNDSVQGRQQVIWFEQESRTDTEINLKSSGFSTIEMEEVLLGSIINRGTDNIFANQGNLDGNINNVERVDFVTADGIVAPVEFLDGVGFLILERGGNDPFQIAAVTEVNEAGEPIAFGELVPIDDPDNQWGDAQDEFDITAEVMRSNTPNQVLQSSAELSTQPISGIFFSYDNLGIVGDQIFHGFSIFPPDIDEDNDLIGLTDFPLDTPDRDRSPGGDNRQIGGLDLISNASIFVRDDIQLPPAITSDGAGDTADIEALENAVAVTDVESIDELDEEGNGLEYTITGGLDAGLFTINEVTGVLEFQTPLDFETPTDSDRDNIYQVEVTVTDTDGLSDVQLLNITLTDENEAPVIISNEGLETVNLELLENMTRVTNIETEDDQDTENNGLIYTISGGLDGAVFRIDENTGELIFLSPPDFEDPADSNQDNIYQLEVTVTDSGGLTDVQAFEIEIINQLENEAPVIISNGGQETANIPLEIDTERPSVVVTNVDSADDLDTEGSGLTYNVVGGSDANQFTIDADTGLLSFISLPSRGNPTDSNQDNTYEVIVNVTDSNNATDSQTLLITPSFLPIIEPVLISAVDDSGITAENTPTILNILANDIGLPDSVDGLITLGNATGGTAQLDPDGNVVFTPNPDFTGVATFSYTLSDGTNSSTGLVSIDVTPVNDPPVAVADSTTTPENQAVTLDVAANDQDRDNSLDLATVAIATAPDNGSVSINPNTGEITYTPNQNFNGTETFTYRIADVEGARSNPATVTVTVDSVNQSPTTDDTSITVAPDDTISFPDLIFDDADGDVTEITFTQVPNPNSGVILLDGEPIQAGQTISVSDLDRLEIQTTDDFSDSNIGFTVTDNEGSTSTPGLISLVRQNDPTPTPTPTPDPTPTPTPTPDPTPTPTPDPTPTPTPTPDPTPTPTPDPTPEPNQPPVASNQDLETEFNTPITFDGLEDVIDPDTPRDQITIDLDPSQPGIQDSLDIPGQGSFTVDDQGNITFTPEDGFSGTVTIPFTVEDSEGGTSDTSEISIFVPNQPPVAIDASIAAIPNNGAVTPLINALRATDPDGTIAQFTLTELPLPEQGTLLLNGNSITDLDSLNPNQASQLRFVPDFNFPGGEVTFTFTATDDGDAISNTATVTLLVDPATGDPFPGGGEDDGDDDEMDNPTIPREDDDDDPQTPGGGEDDDCGCCPSIPEFTAVMFPDRPQLGANPPEGTNSVVNGTTADDLFVAAVDPDWISGNLGNDTLRGNINNDTLRGEAGDDWLFAGLDNIPGPRDTNGQDWLDGGEGDDFLSANENEDFVMGDTGHDIAYGGKGDDQMFGDAGNDTLYGDAGNDTIIGSNGSSNPVGIGEEQDVLYGYRDQDMIQGGPGNDTVYSGKEDDFSFGGKDADWMWGDLGDDTLYGDQGSDTMFGDTNDPEQTSPEGQDLMWGGSGDDFMTGNRNADTLSGGVGNDTVRGGKENDLLFGDVGNDVLFGDLGDDTLCGNEGNDTMYGDTEDDEAPGGADKLSGGLGSDVLSGNQGTDTLSGDDGNDTVYGGKGNDLLRGKAGDDWLWGDEGNDTLAGGEGSDRFVLLPGNGSDLIEDFTIGEDLLVIANQTTFADLSIIQDETSTLINFGDQTIATLNNISADLVSEESFSFETVV